MSLAIDASSPALATTTTTATLTTASFTPPANSLLLIAWGGDSTGTPTTPTITDNLGSHLTYTLKNFQSIASSPGVNGQAATWVATVASSAAMTVSVTTGSGTTPTAGLKIWVLTDSGGTPTAGANGKSGSSSTAAVAQSYTAQATGGWGFIGVTDFAGLGNMTAGTGCTMDATATPGGNDSFGFARRTTADDTNGSSNTLNVNLIATSTAVNWTYVEVKPAVVAAASYPPQAARSRRPTPPRVGRTRQTVPVRAQVNPPNPIQEITQPRRIRGLLARRGKLAQTIPPQFNPPFPWAEVVQARRLRGAPVRRGRAPLPVPPATDLPVVENVQARRLRGLLIRRSKTPVPVPPQFNPPYPFAEVVQPRRWRGLLPRRGHYATPVPGQVVLTPPAYPPQTVRVRTKILRWFRSHLAMPVPPQVTVAPPAWVPDRPHRARLAAAARRGHSTTPVPADAPVPGRARGRRTPPLPPPRRAKPTPPAGDTLVPTGRSSRRPAAPRTRRGATSLPLKQQTPPPNPAFVPSGGHRRLLVAWVRRGRYAIVYRCDCHTHRPSGGTTGRGAGTTTRPNSGTTVDPCC